MKEILISSARGTKIPVLLEEGSGYRGLLLMAHSFRSEKEENGRYSEIAQRMAEKGFLCAAPDFPGNGKSEEPFSSYSLRACLDDLEAVYAYLKEHYEYDRNNCCLLGYSMGGRIISLFLERHKEFSKLVFWASVLEHYDLKSRFLEQDLSSLKKECDEKGYCDFYDIFEEETIRMSKDFIDDLLDRDAQSPLYDFKGSALIVQGEKDTTIDINNAKLIESCLKQASSVRLKYLPEADHGFGLWDGRKEDERILLKETLSFLEQ